MDKKKLIIIGSIVGAVLIAGLATWILSGGEKGQAPVQPSPAPTVTEDPDDDHDPNDPNISHEGHDHEDGEGHLPSPVELEELLEAGSAIVPENTPEAMRGYAIAFTKQWVTYDSSASPESRQKQLSSVVTNPDSWKSTNPVSHYLGDTRDNSDWVITSAATAEPTIDDGLTFSNGGINYITVEVPVQVTRVNKTSGNKMSGSETFSIDLTIDGSGNVTDISGANAMYQ